jgi:hypothetical protein
MDDALDFAENDYAVLKIAYQNLQNRPTINAHAAYVKALQHLRRVLLTVSFDIYSWRAQQGHQASIEQTHNAVESYLENRLKLELAGTPIEVLPKYESPDTYYMTKTQVGNMTRRNTVASQLTLAPSSPNTSLTAKDSSIKFPMPTFSNTIGYGSLLRHPIHSFTVTETHTDKKTKIQRSNSHAKLAFMAEKSRTHPSQAQLEVKNSEGEYSELKSIRTDTLNSPSVSPQASPKNLNLPKSVTHTKGAILTTPTSAKQLALQTAAWKEKRTTAKNQKAQITRSNSTGSIGSVGMFDPKQITKIVIENVDAKEVSVKKPKAKTHQSKPSKS